MNSSCNPDTKQAFFFTQVLIYRPAQCLLHRPFLQELLGLTTPRGKGTHSHQHASTCPPPAAHPSGPAEEIVSHPLRLLRVPWAQTAWLFSAGPGALWYKLPSLHSLQAAIALKSHMGVGGRAISSIRGLIPQTLCQKQWCCPLKRNPSYSSLKRKRPPGKQGRETPQALGEERSPGGGTLVPCVLEGTRVERESQGKTSRL